MTDPIIMWAILYDYTRPYIDHLTISYTRKDAWAKWGESWTHKGELLSQAKRYRRQRKHRAIRVTIEEHTQ